MTSETQANNNVVGVYTYNADGQRARRNIGGIETWQVYGTGGELLAEYAATAAPASPQKEYGYRNGQLLVTVGVDGEIPVSWINAVSVSISGNSLTKTGFGRSAWNGGASSEKGINSGDGYMEFTASETNKARRAGLSQGDTNQSWDDIDFCIFLDANGTVSINEGPTLRGSFGNYGSGDRFRVGVEGGVVKYRKNGTLLYTSTVVPGYPLIVDTSFFTVGATINNVVTYTTDLRWFVTDQLGTPRMIFDQTGALVNVKRHDYLPFGEELSAGQGARTTTQGYSAADGVRQKFTQKERDIETGLDYFGARYYASTQGRFTSADPLLASGMINDPQTWNRYSYALGNPLKYIDPLGLYVFTDELGGDREDGELLWKAFGDKKKTKAAKSIIEKRNKIRSALNAARDAANKSPDNVRAELETALASYGTFNDKTHDNVVVGLVEKSGQSSTTALGAVDGKIHVDLNLDQSDKDPAVTVAHEGSHVADFQAFITNRGGSSGGAYDETGYITEMRAYYVSSFMAQALGLKSYYPDDNKESQVWNRGWKENQREVYRARGVSAKNGWSATNQGPKLSDPRFFNQRY